MDSDNDMWYFSKEQLENTPSRECGYDSSKELSYRRNTAYFIHHLGKKLRVTQLCINTAIVYMHRFYVLHSFSRFHWQQLAAAALFLSAKTEEQPRRLEYIIRFSNFCRNPQDTDIDLNSERYKTQFEDILFNENVLLQTLGFDVTIEHPHLHIVRICYLVGASNDLAQTAYNMATFSLQLTTMCIQYKPTVVACFCIFLACKWTKWEIYEENENKEWYSYVDQTVTAELLQQLIEEYWVVFENHLLNLEEKNTGNTPQRSSSSDIEQENEKVPQSGSMKEQLKTLMREQSKVPCRHEEERSPNYSTWREEAQKSDYLNETDVQVNMNCLDNYSDSQSSSIYTPKEISSRSHSPTVTVLENSPTLEQVTKEMNDMRINCEFRFVDEELFIKKSSLLPSEELSFVEEEVSIKKPEECTFEEEGVFIRKPSIFSPEKTPTGNSKCESNLMKERIPSTIARERSIFSPDRTPYNTKPESHLSKEKIASPVFTRQRSIFSPDRTLPRGNVLEEHTATDFTPEDISSVPHLPANTMATRSTLQQITQQINDVKINSEFGFAEVEVPMKKPSIFSPERTPTLNSKSDPDLLNERMPSVTTAPQRSIFSPDRTHLPECIWDAHSTSICMNSQFGFVEEEVSMKKPSIFSPKTSPVCGSKPESDLVKQGTFPSPPTLRQRSIFSPRTPPSVSETNPVSTCTLWKEAQSPHMDSSSLLQYPTQDNDAIINSDCGLVEVEVFTSSVLKETDTFSPEEAPLDSNVESNTAFVHAVVDSTSALQDASQQSQSEVEEKKQHHHKSKKRNKEKHRHRNKDSCNEKPAEKKKYKHKDRESLQAKNSTGSSIKLKIKIPKDKINTESLSLLSQPPLMNDLKREDEKDLHLHLSLHETKSEAEDDPHKQKSSRLQKTDCSSQELRKRVEKQRKEECLEVQQRVVTCEKHKLSSEYNRPSNDPNLKKPYAKSIKKVEDKEVQLDQLFKPDVQIMFNSSNSNDDSQLKCRTLKQKSDSTIRFKTDCPKAPSNKCDSLYRHKSKPYRNPETNNTKKQLSADDKSINASEFLPKESVGQATAEKQRSNSTNSRRGDSSKVISNKHLKVIHNGKNNTEVPELDNLFKPDVQTVVYRLNNNVDSRLKHSAEKLKKDSTNSSKVDSSKVPFNKRDSLYYHDKSKLYLKSDITRKQLGASVSDKNSACFNVEASKSISKQSDAQENAPNKSRDHSSNLNSFAEKNRSDATNRSRDHSSKVFSSKHDSVQHKANVKKDHENNTYSKILQSVPRQNVGQAYASPKTRESYNPPPLNNNTGIKSVTDLMKKKHEEKDKGNGEKDKAPEKKKHKHRNHDSIHLKEKHELKQRENHKDKAAKKKKHKREDREPIHKDKMQFSPERSTQVPSTGLKINNSKDQIKVGNASEFLQPLTTDRLPIKISKEKINNYGNLAGSSTMKRKRNRTLLSEFPPSKIFKSSHKDKETTKRH